MAKKRSAYCKRGAELLFGAILVVVDTATGVNYLVTYGSGANGVTPLLDANGNVVVDSTARYMPE